MLKNYIENLKHKATALEAELNQLFALHNQKQGVLQTTKNIIDDLSKLGTVIAPESVITEALNAADSVINMLESEPSNP